MRSFLLNSVEDFFDDITFNEIELVFHEQLVVLGFLFLFAECSCAELHEIPLRLFDFPLFLLAWFKANLLVFRVQDIRCFLSILSAVGIFEQDGHFKDIGRFIREFKGFDCVEDLLFVFKQLVFGFGEHVILNEMGFRIEFAAQMLDLLAFSVFQVHVTRALFQFGNEIRLFVSSQFHASLRSSFQCALPL